MDKTGYRTLLAKAIDFGRGVLIRRAPQDREALEITGDLTFTGAVELEPEPGFGLTIDSGLTITGELNIGATPSAGTSGFLLASQGDDTPPEWIDPATVGVTDHGNLDGLTDDDHTQYVLADGSRSMAALTVTGEINVGATPGAGTSGYLLASQGDDTPPEWIDPSTVGVTDHGNLDGLTDDDHTQYMLRSEGPWEEIGRVVTSSSQAVVTFTSIPATYKSLALTIIGRCGSTVAPGGQNIVFQLNNDTGSTYQFLGIDSNGTTVSTFDSGGLGTNGLIAAIPCASDTATYSGSVLVYILNYANTSFYKNIQAFPGAALSEGSAPLFFRFTTSSWKSTAAISEIDLFFPSSRVWADNSVLVLYGIGAA